MHDRRLNRLLDRIHRPDPTKALRPSHQQELGNRLLADFRAKKSQRPLANSGFHARGRLPWHRTARYAYFSLTLLMLSLGACTISTTTELKMGQKVVIEMAAQPDLVLAEVNRELLAFLQLQPDIENVSASLSELSDGSAVFSILIWGNALPWEQLLADLRRCVPTLATADIQTEPLAGTMKETLAAKWKRKLLRLEIDPGTEDEIRAQIMTQLAAQGIDNGALVDVKIDGEQTGITITVEEETE